MRAGAGKLQVATAASVAPFAAAALPEALVRALPETDAGAISGDAADAVRDLAESADAVLIGPGMADKEETAGVRGAAAPAPDGAAGAGRPRPRLRHRRRRLPAPPRRPGRPHPESAGARLRAARRAGGPGGRPGRLRRWTWPRRARAVVGLGGVTSWIAAPDGAALAGRQRRGGPGRLRVGRRARRDHRRAARPRGRSGAGRGLGGLRARPLRGAAVLDGRAARLPGPRAAAGDPASTRRDHRLTARLRRRRDRGGRRATRQLHR